MTREFRDSGIDWIGQIPKEWNLIRGKYLFSVLNGYAFDSSLFTNDTNMVPLIRIRDINNSETEAYYLGEYPSEYIVKKDEILVGMDGDFNVSRWKGKDALLNQRVCKLRNFSESFISQYAYYILPLILKTKNDVTYATTVKHLSSYDILNFVFIVPSISCQQKIADYLDKVCGEVDEIITLQEQMIEELKAYKQSIITEAVTKGLNPNVPMKNSGIDWIGEVPEHWEVRRIGNLFKLRDEKNYKPMDEVQLLSLYTGIGVFPHGEQEERGNKAITVEGYKVVHKNDIVVNIILAWMGAIGVSNYDGVTSPAYDVYIPNLSIVVPHFFHYVFRTQGIAGECYKYGRGIMMMRWRTYSSEFKQIRIPFPSLDEQHAIADYLDTRCAEIDALVEIKQSKVEELKEYKKSVIYEYVTGKKEVPYGE